MTEIWRNARVAKDGELSDFAKADVICTLHDLTFAVHQTAREHDWWTCERSLGELIALMHSELSEALEAWRDNEPYLWFKHNFGPGLMHGPNEYSTPTDTYSEQREFRGVLGKPEGLAAEFADVIIRILDTCQYFNIPIAEALLRKHAYNLTRPSRHGGKKA